VRRRDCGQRRDDQPATKPGGHGNTVAQPG
jgi:hypothetical protein